MNKLVKVIIQIYKSELDSNEYKSLIQCEKVFCKHPKAIVCPVSILSEIKSKFPHWEERDRRLQYLDAFQNFL